MLLLRCDPVCCRSIHRLSAALCGALRNAVLFSGSFPSRDYWLVGLRSQMENMWPVPARGGGGPAHSTAWGMSRGCCGAAGRAACVGRGSTGSCTRHSSVLMRGPRPTAPIQKDACGAAPRSSQQRSPAEPPVLLRSSWCSGAEVLICFVAKILVPFVGIKQILFGLGSLKLQREIESRLPAPFCAAAMPVFHPKPSMFCGSIAHPTQWL